LALTPQQYSSLSNIIVECKTADQSKFTQKLNRYKDDDSSDEIARLITDIEASYEWVNKRRANNVELLFPQLPVSERREEIAEAISHNQVVIIAGETGSGKTTQLPKICLSLGLGVKGLIGHTQPRRIAARSVANRIAEELKVPLGGLVGYQVRFTDVATDATAIKLMTDGILLAEIQNDRYLSRYDTIIIDEAHERSLNIDFLLGYLKQLLPKRPDLKVIITSATIDVEKFSHHFNDAPVIEVSGRTFPVETLYRPLLETDSDSLLDAIVNAIDEITTLDNQGDILVFLSGERDIRETALRLRREEIAHLSIVPLYARLSVSEQNKIFQPHRGRRVVLATNVAETSLTVPGIRYVIDPGYARISRYSFRTKVQRLPIESISQASANQRQGRCGRVSEGVCIRLYSEQDFLSRPEFTDPEILRTNLAAVILQMAQLKLGDIRHFPFLEMPDHRLINDGYQLLQELQAINSRNHLTTLGRRLAQLPVDPRFARMLVAAQDWGCLNEMLIIISALSVQDPRERPADKQQAADQCHRLHWDEKSDFLAYVNLWQSYELQRQTLSNSQCQKWCKKNFLVYMRMREWRDIHTQLHVAAKKLALKVNIEPASYASIHTALLTGLLANVGNFSKEKTNDYFGARNRRFQIFPGSSQFKKKPQWLFAAELLETSKLYGHTAASIETDWILAVAQHLIKRQHIEPHYDARNGQVMAYEKISLYGLVIVEKKQVSYSKINPVECRKVFIRAALVEGRYSENKRVHHKIKNTSADKHFFCWQQQLLKELHELEAKSRRRDIIVDDEILYEFYDKRLPDDVINFDGFEAWREKIEQTQPRLLFIERDQMMQRNDAHIEAAQFPDSLAMSGIRVPVMYHFDPTHLDDGVTIRVPVSALHLLSEDRLEWLVPGLLAEKVTAMIKALPKQWRKQFAPVPSTVEKILPKLIVDSASSPQKVSQKPESLRQVVATQLYRYKGIEVPSACWQEQSLDAYYNFNIHVLDERGKLMDQGRNLSMLRDRYRDHVQDQLQIVGNDFEQSKLTEWSFGDLPKTHLLQQNGLEIRVFPGLVDQGDSVDLKLYDNDQEAEICSIRGMVRLAILTQAPTIKYLRKQLLKNKDLGLSVVDMGSRDQVIDDIICAAVKQTCFDYNSSGETGADLCRTQKDFTVAVEATKSQWVERAELTATLLIKSLALVVAIKKQAKQAKNALTIAYAMSDINSQLSGLFYRGCLYSTPYQWLQQYPRYLSAIAHRLEKVPMHVNQDRAHIAELEVLYMRLQDALLSQNLNDVKLTAMNADTEKTKVGKAKSVNAGNADQTVLYYALPERYQQYRWMLEELRVSLFAQALTTLVPVSIKRLHKQWELSV
jgi:ATP-dependent helicase HrpA